MQRALSTHLFVQHHLTTALLDKIFDSGIGLVEIFCARQHFDYTNKSHVSELGHWFRDSELKLHSIHAPMYNDDVWGRTGPQSVLNICEPVKPKRIQAVDEIKRAIELAEKVPFRYVIQHLGVAGEEFDMRKVDAAFSSLEELNLFAKARGVEVLLENTPNELASSERLLFFFEATHMNLNVCFDTGHAHMREGVETAYRELKSRVRSTHVHDNDGKDDQHLFPLIGGGSIDWAHAMDTLRLHGDRYPLMLELREVVDMADPLSKVREVFDRLEHTTARSHHS